MDVSAHPIFVSLLWYEEVTLLFVLFYPVLGILMARRRLASGQGSVALATVPLTAGAVLLWVGHASVGDDTLRMYTTSLTTVAGLRAVFLDGGVGSERLLTDSGYVALLS